jgi:hypothetical protein
LVSSTFSPSIFPWFNYLIVRFNTGLLFPFSSFFRRTLIDFLRSPWRFPVLPASSPS